MPARGAVEAVAADADDLVPQEAADVEDVVFGVEGDPFGDEVLLGGCLVDLTAVRGGDFSMRLAPTGDPLVDEIADVAKLMEDRKLNGVLVVDEKEELVGILTTTNCLEALIGFARAYGK